MPTEYPLLVDQSGKQVLLDVSPFIVGRHLPATTVNLSLADPHVSRRQFQITFEDGDYFIEQLSDIIPTKCNGQAIKEKTILSHRTVIHCGHSSFTFFLSADVAPKWPENFGGMIIEKPAVMPVDTTEIGCLPTDEQDHLSANRPPIVLTDHLILGRDKTHGNGYLEHNLVSRKHARITIIDGQFFLTDLGSANGTFVNTQKILISTQLKNGDKVDIGPYSFRFDVRGQFIPAIRQTTSSLSCRDITYTVTDRNTGYPLTLLNAISLSMLPQDFICLIGPSGSGKTTLLDMLSGRKTKTNGSVAMYGRDLHQNFEILKQQIAVVPQRDILYETLSTLEGLTYTAKLRLPPDTNDTEIVVTVDRTIKEVGLTERAATPVSYLSGGQRKRACLGNEILSQPEILFLDEVTSGLDEESDREIMGLVKRIVGGGKTAVMVTHNLVNVEEFCTKIVILTKGGFLAFYGSPQEAKEYFGVKTLGRIYEKLAGRPAEEWKREFLQSSFYKRYIAEKLSDITEVAAAPVQPKNRSEQAHYLFRQFMILLQRRFKIQCNEWMSLVAMLGQCLVVAVLISMLFGNVKDGNSLEKATWSSQILFLSVISCLWFGCNNTAKEIVKERNIYSRERAANLSEISYYASKFVFFGIIGGLQALLLWFVVATGTKMDVNFTTGLVLLVLLATVGTVLGLCISVFSKTEEFASSMVPLVIIPQIILAGFIHKVESILWLISSCFIPAYWGYGGTASLLEKSSREILIPTMSDWNYPIVAMFALVVQLAMLAGVAVFHLLREKGD